MQSQVAIGLLSKIYSFVSIICIQSSNLIAQIAQSVEQRTENPCVGGSIPPLGTISKAFSIFDFYEQLIYCSYFFKTSYL